MYYISPGTSGKVAIPTGAGLGVHEGPREVIVQVTAETFNGGLNKVS